MAGRPEGVVSHNSPTSSLVAESAGTSRAATPSVTFGDIPPQGGRLGSLRQPCALDSNAEQRLPCQRDREIRPPAGLQDRRL